MRPNMVKVNVADVQIVSKLKYVMMYLYKLCLFAI